MPRPCPSSAGLRGDQVIHLAKHPRDLGPLAVERQSGVEQVRHPPLPGRPRQKRAARQYPGGRHQPSRTVRSGRLHRQRVGLRGQIPRSPRQHTAPVSPVAERVDIPLDPETVGTRRGGAIPQDRRSDHLPEHLSLQPRGAASGISTDESPAMDRRRSTAAATRPAAGWSTAVTYPLSASRPASAGANP